MRKCCTFMSYINVVRLRVQGKTKPNGYDLALSLNLPLSHSPYVRERNWAGRMAHVCSKAHKANDRQTHGCRTIDVWTDG